MYKEQTSVYFHIIKKSFPFFIGGGGRKNFRFSGHIYAKIH